MGKWMLTFKLEQRGNAGTWWLVHNNGLERYAEAEEVDLWKRLLDTSERAFAIMANVSAGDLTKQNDDWRGAFEQWRDGEYHPLLSSQRVIDGVAGAGSTGQLEPKPPAEEGLKDPSPVVSDGPSDLVTTQPGSAAGDNSQAEPTVPDSRSEDKAVEVDGNGVAERAGNGNGQSPVGRKARRANNPKTV